MSAQAALTRTYSIRPGLTVTFSGTPPQRGSVNHLYCEWDPAMPKNLSALEQRRYESARDHFMNDLMADAKESI